MQNIENMVLTEVPKVMREASDYALSIEGAVPYGAMIISQSIFPRSLISAVMFHQISP